MSSTAVLTKGMLEAIDRSGYLVEQRLVPLVERLGYKATPNDRFRDVETGAVREIDISAITAGQVGKRGFDFIFPILLIAVKALRCPLVFFTQKELRLHYFLGQLQMSGLPQEIIDGRERTVSLSEFLKLEDFHHYYRTGRIASQFCAVYECKKGDQGKREKGESQKPEPSYEAGHIISGRIDLFSDLEGLAMAVEADKTKHATGLCRKFGGETVNLQIYYPVFVTTGPLVECFVGARRAAYRRVHRVGFLLRHSIGGTSRDYHIDVVDEAGLKSLLKVIDKDTERMVERLQRKRSLVSASMIHFVKKLRRQNAEAKSAYMRGDSLTGRSSSP